MLLLRSLPDLAACSADALESPRARGGQENCIIWGRSRRAEFGPYPTALSIRAVWGGTQFCHLQERTIAVDDDAFLVLNPGRVYSTSIRAIHPVESLTICFQSDLVDAMEQPPDFIENLQPHDAT